MKKNDVFKSQGGYGVARGVYLDSPVMGTIAWFAEKEDAETYAGQCTKYDEAYAEWERIGETEAKLIYADWYEKLPLEKDYITIKPDHHF